MRSFHIIKGYVPLLRSLFTVSTVQTVCQLSRKQLRHQKLRCQVRLGRHGHSHNIRMLIPDIFMGCASAWRQHRREQVAAVELTLSVL
jgi:hypothetical protein